MKIALVIGHNERKKGAYGNMGIPEYDFYKILLDEIASELLADHKTFERLTDVGYTEQMVDLHKRIDEYGADVSISFHFNASNKQYVHGSETLYFSKKGKELATKMQTIFEKNLDNNNRGIKKRTKKQRGGGFLARGKSVCILIEPFFASEQNKYVHGGSMRESLKDSIAELIESLQ